MRMNLFKNYDLYFWSKLRIGTNLIEYFNEENYFYQLTNITRVKHVDCRNIFACQKKHFYGSIAHFAKLSQCG